MMIPWKISHIPIAVVYDVYGAVLSGAAVYEKGTPSNTRHLYNIYTMLHQRRRRWAVAV